MPQIREILGHVDLSTARPAIRVSPGYAQRSAITPARRGSYKPALLITQRCSYGSAISPVLANLFLHYAFDAGMARSFPGCPFERFADDIVVHCRSRRQAEYVLAAIAARLGEVGLRIHPDKTRIVYCKDGRRRGDHEHTSFTFLGFTFRARGARGTKSGRAFTGFLPAMSTEALEAKSDRLRRMRIHRRTDLTLEHLAEWLNPITAGWSGSTARRRVSLAADGLLAAARRTGHAHS